MPDILAFKKDLQITTSPTTGNCWVLIVSAITNNKAKYSKQPIKKVSSADPSRKDVVT